ncbi:hypothetical protein NA56DRAFT_559518, partial [Hyaloscypha hepaticicola]
LIGGRHFILPYIISKNGFYIPLTTLTDSGANGFVFINMACIINITKFLNLKVQSLI